MTGDGDDGPEWGQKPYTNMFAAGTGSVDPKYPVSTLFGKLVQPYSAAQVALYAESISPDSVQANTNEDKSITRGAPGAKVVVNDTTVVYGSTDFGPEVLVAKSNNANVVWSNLAADSNVALGTAIKQAGVKTKAVFFPVGYSPTLIHSPSWYDVQSDIFEVVYHPFYEPDTGTKQMQSALERYDGWTKSHFPTYSQDSSWLSTELMIQGLEGAGSNPTRASVIKSLHSIKDCNGNGLIPYTTNYSTDFGRAPSANCVWLTRAEKNGFVPLGEKPVCGTFIPGTTSVSS